MFISLIIMFLIGMICTYLLLRVLIPLLKDRIIDNPNNRSLHLRPTPRGGGIAFVGITIILIIIESLIYKWSPLASLSLALLPLSFVGLLDDIYDVSSLTRYFVQVITSIFIINISFDYLHFNFYNSPLFAILAIYLILIVFIGT